MEQSKQLVSRELAERMKALGFVQISKYEWIKYYVGSSEKTEWILLSVPQKEPHGIERISAYSVAELGEMLPVELPIPARATDYWCDYILTITKDRNDKEEWWEVSYCGSGDAGCYVVKTNTVLVNAMAEVLLYLAEQGILDPKSIKI